MNPRPSVTVINRGAIRFSEGTNAPRDCGVASTSNTDRIVVKASANPTGAQNTIIDERIGDFSDSAVFNLDTQDSIESNII